MRKLAYIFWGIAAGTVIYQVLHWALTGTWQPICFADGFFGVIFWIFNLFEINYVDTFVDFWDNSHILKWLILWPLSLWMIALSFLVFLPEFFRGINHERN